MSLYETNCCDCWETIVECTCDSCARKENHHGTIATVSEWLRKTGWKTVPGEKASSPMKWICKSCK